MTTKRTTRFFATTGEIMAAAVAPSTAVGGARRPAAASSAAAAGTGSSTSEPLASDGPKLTANEIKIDADCPKVCRHLVTIVSGKDENESNSSIMTGADIARLLYKHGLHADGEEQHPMWSHISSVLKLGSEIKDIEDALKHDRRYRKSAARRKTTEAPVDKKLLEHKRRLSQLLRDQIKQCSSQIELYTNTIGGAEIAGDAEVARLNARKAQLTIDLNAIEAEVAQESDRLLKKYEASQAARLQKRQSKTIAGTSAAQLNHKNRNRFKAHDNSTGAPYPLTMQNTVSKQKLMHPVMPIENTTLLFRANFMSHNFPAPSIATHAPRATITHSASGEIGCAGARSTEASQFVAQRYASLISMYTHEEMQLANVGEVNAAASAGWAHMIDLVKFNDLARRIPSMVSIYEPTLIGIHRWQEKVPPAAERKGMAFNTSGTARVCCVGGRQNELKAIEDGPFRVLELMVKMCMMRPAAEAQVPSSPAPAAAAASPASASASATVSEGYGPVRRQFKHRQRAELPFARPT